MFPSSLDMIKAKLLKSWLKTFFYIVFDLSPSVFEYKNTSYVKELRRNNWCLVNMNLKFSLRLISCSDIRTTLRLVDLENIREANKENVGQTSLSALVVTPEA